MNAVYAGILIRTLTWTMYHRYRTRCSHQECRCNALQEDLGRQTVRLLLAEKYSFDAALPALRIEL